MDLVLTCAIPAPICPPPMIVTCLIAAALTAEDDRPLQTWWVKKAMIRGPAAATGFRTDTDPDSLKSGRKVGGHVIMQTLLRPFTHISTGVTYQLKVANIHRFLKVLQVVFHG